MSDPSERRQFDPPRKLLVVLPNWVGDVVLATPVFAAIRSQFANARITFLMRPLLGELVAGGGWHDDEIAWPPGKGIGAITSATQAAKLIRAARPDAALLFTNSFKSAFTVWSAAVPRRIGYDRDGRGWMLTHRLKPLKRGGVFVPTPILPYYCALAEAIGCEVTDRKLRLVVTPEQEAGGAALKAAYKIADGQRYAIINPGAAFGAAKCWLPERFAELCGLLHKDLGLLPVIVGAPNEAPLMEHIAGMVNGPVVCASKPQTTLGTLKPLIRDAALLVCNDTGPRHYGNAFDVPTVCIFGPTHQEWTDTDYAGEIKLQAKVPCGPCQLKTCPLDLRCQKEVSVNQVLSACRSILRVSAASTC